AFGQEPRLARRKLVDLHLHDAEIGADLRVVETDDDIAFRYRRALTDEDLSDHSAGRVLHALDIALDDDEARGDDRAAEHGVPRPAAETDHEQQHGEDGSAVQTADGVPHLLGVLAHGATSPPAERAGTICTAAVKTARRTSSRGPKVCTRPPARNSALSQA